MIVRILPSAKRDLLEGADFYDEQAAGLGAKFIARLIETIDELERLGGIHAKKYGAHWVIDPVFPYAVFYNVVGDEVHVHTILDCRRRPAWLRQQVRRRLE